MGYLENKSVLSEACHSKVLFCLLKGSYIVHRSSTVNMECFFWGESLFCNIKPEYISSDYVVASARCF